QIRINKLILFGSYAHGVPKEESDIDLIVISDDFEDKGFWARIEILSDAIFELFEPIEALAMTPAEWAAGGSDRVYLAEGSEVVYAA
ncbi:MAG: nucleotidyltransferase domain-containing protein, partial [Deltaproteobacteria bacterium]|nr:nucleotidyltransferase domain-containing protein [Deltaproteobacteria bacterium]